MNVPFVDLKAQYLRIKPEMDAAISECIENTAFIGGSQVKDFEKAFAQWVGTKHCIACANGTDSIEILLQAMGVGKGDEVIVPAHSWISTAEAVSTVGGTPVFVDCHPDYFTIDVNKVEEKITDRTKAIIPVHIYGMACDMGAIMDIARKHNLKVMEDCAQAHGATFNGQKVGTFGDAASFSFYPGKNLGAYGDAGGMVTDNDDIATTARMIAHHGQLEKHDHQIEGRNSRMDTIQAAVLNVKLPHLDTWTRERQEKADRYNELLADLGIQLPKVSEGSTHVYHLYVVQLDERDAIADELKELGIGTAVHYPTPMPLMPAYSRFGHTEADFPVASAYSKRILSLPMFPEMTEEMMQHVKESLEKVLSNRAVAQ